MRQVHDWFLQRGLPLVLTRRVRSRALMARAAPAVAGVGALTAAVLLLAEWTGGDPQVVVLLRLAGITTVLAAAPFALEVLHRRSTTAARLGRRTTALAVMGIFVLVMPFAVSGLSAAALAEVPVYLTVTVLTIWLTYIGLGSIALWAFRFAWEQVGALGTLLSRALPLLMLTVVVYFTGELWQLSARVTRERLWQTIGFLAAVGLAFMVTTIRDEVSALRQDRTRQSDPGALLAETPLARLAPGTPTPLSRPERVNVVAVMVVAQAIQVVLFTTGLFLFFIALGFVAVPPDVLVLWSGEQSCPVGVPPCDGTWFGVHVPVPQTVVHMSLFVAVLSGLYFTVSTSVDPLYRERFFEPLISDVAVSLAGRDTYLAMHREEPIR
ncbi:hypothetical protein EUA04_12195 [Mycolicibacterium obuense]|uniref:Integral membrane protein n=1 Tax=Mycolicibacterium obuense TaxID=1807 RepID=A0A4V3AYU8_9MYCO|nr:hypothetical protein [Mycolicibacterium obuense]TDL08679.1 hypothetical protein EUA04_12195 [Mycolicibacterium obuense]